MERFHNEYDSDERIHDSMGMVMSIMGYYNELLNIEERIHQIFDQVDGIARVFDEYGPQFRSKYTFSEDIRELKLIAKKIEDAIRSGKEFSGE